MVSIGAAVAGNTAVTTIELTILYERYVLFHRWEAIPAGFVAIAPAIVSVFASAVKSKDIGAVLSVIIAVYTVFAANVPDTGEGDHTISAER